MPFASGWETDFVWYLISLFSPTVSSGWRLSDVVLQTILTTSPLICQFGWPEWNCCWITCGFVNYCEGVFAAFWFSDWPKPGWHGRFWQDSSIGKLTCLTYWCLLTLTVQGETQNRDGTWPQRNFGQIPKGACRCSRARPSKTFQPIPEGGSVVPEDNVTPIHKKGGKGYPENYRPVSLTAIPCRVMESCLRDKIVSHLNQML